MPTSVPTGCWHNTPPQKTLHHRKQGQHSTTENTTQALLPKQLSHRSSKSASTSSHTPASHQAELADRDFTAERTQIVVASGGAVDPVASERAEVERRAAEARHAHRLRLPRRPAWDARTTPEELDLQVWGPREWAEGMAEEGMTGRDARTTSEELTCRCGARGSGRREWRRRE
eukprot:361743-Chlamydomonas_euryale.AAC.3